MHACDVAVMVTNKAMELMGAYGYVRDYDVEKYWRDYKMIQVWEGGAQLGRLDVCRVTTTAICERDLTIRIVE